MSEELNPCPFCGYKGIKKPKKEGGWICMNCGSEGFGNWNARPIEDALRADNERMKAALEWIVNWAQAYPPESLSQQSTSDIPSIGYKIKLVERIAREGLEK